MLTTFNKTVLFISTILLIIGLVIVANVIIKNKSNEEYPPVVSDCPDYWDVDYDSQGKKHCKNNIYINDGLSTAACRSYPHALFSANGSSLEDVVCEKSKWAKDCNIHWDGITNNPNACVNTTINTSLL